MENPKMDFKQYLNVISSVTNHSNNIVISGDFLPDVINTPTEICSEKDVLAILELCGNTGFFK